MGFLRQKEDGSTTLAIIVPTDGIDKKTRERPVLLGSFIGKLNHGSGNVQGFREDKRNFVKTGKFWVVFQFVGRRASNSTKFRRSEKYTQFLFTTEETFTYGSLVHHGRNLRL